MGKIELAFFTTETGKAPFLDWERTLDKTVQATISARFLRIRMGNFGDAKRIKRTEIYELRIDLGPGYRIFFGKEEPLIIIILGGTKKCQQRNILKAEQY